MQNQDIITLAKWIDESESIVFFGGAGVSTESGIPDFRSADGLYNQSGYVIPPEQILSHSFFYSNTAEFYKFYLSKMIFLSAKPNYTHVYLAELEKQGKLDAVVTQNIDNLHQAAGSKTVYELHGSVFRNYCTRCNKFYTAEDMAAFEGDIPHCSCGGLIKPDVVLYEEGLDGDVWDNAMSAIENCDMLIVGGTSLSVYPAAGLVSYYSGNKLVLINRDYTPYDNSADLVIHGSLGEVFAEVADIREDE